MSEPTEFDWALRVSTLALVVIMGIGAVVAIFATGIAVEKWQACEARMEAPHD